MTNMKTEIATAIKNHFLQKAIDSGDSIDLTLFDIKELENVIESVLTKECSTNEVVNMVK
jgi:hypothetical protein